VDRRARVSEPYVHSIRIRYGECDMQRVVFNAHYMAYCDDAVERWLATRSVNVFEVGWDFMLKKAVLEWQGSATVHETIDIRVEAVRWGNTSFDVLFTGTVDGRPVFTNSITYVGVKLGTTETMAPPEHVKQALSA
jgi:acyl-CoA thioester hydrolase